ncbi:hypothetical protein MNBD_NITROSPINAE04-463 [hydrothermal vent metagenome]|uniref:Uncharacterized protein n=1 Tax=hydrothermal vent metagenome TaxID=652676 RepID=A0A3B1CJ06_9ZZZZ
MKPQSIIVICVLAVVLYFGYGQFSKTSLDSNKDIRDSFQALSVAIASKNPIIIKNLISPGFSDPKIGAKEFIEILSLPRKSYVTKINQIRFQGDLGSVFYTRSETRGGGAPIINYNINGETWIQDKNNPSVWRLHRLAKGDKWFRTAEIPMKKAPAQVVAKAGKPVLGSLKTEKVSMSLGEGGRYSPVGRRDPFRPLIAMGGEEIAGVENCDPERPREHLESFDLLSLKLTGVIITSSMPLALVRAPDGKGYTVKAGMYLGRMCGEVVEIDPDFMVIREKKRAPGGLPGVFDPVKTILKLRYEEG